MRIFLVGEGRHDIGDLAVEPPHRTGKPGFLQPIVERVIGLGATFDGRKITLLGKRRVPGVSEALAQKARMASLLADNAESELLVFVSDLDRNGHRKGKDPAAAIEGRKAEIRRGHEAAATDRLGCVPGIPCRTIEAWALGDLDAVASFIESGKNLRLPGGKGPEDLWGTPRDPKSNHPKMVLKRVLGRDGTQEDLAGIAERADIATVRDACPLSFDPFVAELEEAAA